MEIADRRLSTNINVTSTGIPRRLTVTKLGHTSQNWHWGTDGTVASDETIAPDFIHTPFGQYHFTRGWGCSLDRVTRDLVEVVVNYMNYYGFTTSYRDTVWDLYQQARRYRPQPSIEHPRSGYYHPIAS
jgi:hypothetical protein